MVEFGARVRFRHPLARSAAYRSASPQDRQRRASRASRGHRSAASIPDRRAWHRAQAAPGPDEEVATELERAAGGRKRAGAWPPCPHSWSARRTLTPDPARRTERALTAAEAKVQAGAFGAALELLGGRRPHRSTSSSAPASTFCDAQLAFVSNRGRDAPPLLLSAARRLERIDADLARATYLDTVNAAMFAGHLASPGGGVHEVAQAARAAPPAPQPPQAPDLLLDGLARHFSEGYAAGLPVLERALSAFGREMSAAEQLRWLRLASVTALHLWDDQNWDALSSLAR